MDDSESDRQVVRHHLNHIPTLTVESFEAETIETAMQSLRDDDIDICLVDYRLGAGTADVLSQELVALNDNLPVILMSGCSRNELEAHVPDKLLMYFLNKGQLSPLLLELSIRHAVNSHRVTSLRQQPH